MPRLSKQESEKLARHIEEIERYAAETDTILSDAVVYEDISLKLHQQAGTIPADLDKTAVYKIPALKKLIKSAYDKAGRLIKARPKPPRQIRYKSHHVRLGTRETTISLHPVLETMLSLYLDMKPGTPPARKAVRAWMQHRLDQYGDPGGIAVSHWLQGVIVEELVNSDLKRKYDEWLLG